MEVLLVCFTVVEVAQLSSHQLLFKTNPYDITEPDLTSQYEGMQATVVAASMGVPSGQEVPS